MFLIKKIKEALKEPYVGYEDVEDDNILITQKKILKNKKLVKQVFKNYYFKCYSASNWILIICSLGSEI